MAERLPMLVDCDQQPNGHVVLLLFDSELTTKQIDELRDLISLKFAGQLRRDPNAPQTKPPEPGT